MKRGKVREILASRDSIRFAACRAYVKANLRDFAFDDDHVSDESSEAGKSRVNDYQRFEENSEYLVSHMGLEITFI